MSVNNFKLTLDTTAPSGTIARTSQYVQQTTSVTLTQSGNAEYMKVWFDTSASTTTVPTTATWEAFSSTKSLTMSTNGRYYAHAVFLDNVGNQSAVAHSAIIVADTVSPTVTIKIYDLDSGSETLTNDKTVKVVITASDTGTIQSGLDNIVISGDTTTRTISAAELSSGSVTLTDVVLSGSDGEKTINAVATDLSGNKSTTASATITLDTVGATATLALKASSSATTEIAQYINAASNSFVAVITPTSGVADIAYYQIYGNLDKSGINAAYSDSAWVAWTASPTVVDGLAFTTGDGTKTVNFALKDKAGNITRSDGTNPQLTAKTRVYDNTNPVPTIKTDKSWIANGATGATNTATITFSATDATAGVKSTSLSCNGTTIASATSPYTFSKDTAGAKVGANTITLTVVDNAGNTASSSVTVNIEKEIVISSAALNVVDAGLLVNYYYNDSTSGKLKVDVSSTATSGVKEYYAWVDSTASSTTPATGTTAVAYTASSQTLSYENNQITWTKTESNSLYVHIKAVSNVGNTVVSHVGPFGYDKTNPTFTVAAATAHTNSASQTINLTSVADNMSGIYQYKIEGSGTSALGTNPAADWQTVSASTSATVTLATSAQVDGNKTLTVSVRDKANNVTIKSVTWEYDTTAPAGYLNAYSDSAYSTAKESPTAVKAVYLKVGYTKDSTDEYTAVQYRLYGDIALKDGGTAISQESATWQAMTGLTTNAGVFYLTDNASTATADGEVKSIYLQLKDDAGNIWTSDAYTITYAPGAPEVTISNVSHYVISCVHELRKTGTGTNITDVTGDYCDMISFKVTTNMNVQQWKVCAYKSDSFPSTSDDPAKATPIAAREGTYSTSGYSATGVKTNNFTVIVDGQDYRAALGGSASVSVDGIHYIVVYVQGENGNWSAVGPVNSTGTV